MEVHLEIFEGPLELLLHLVKKNSLSIFDIPISKITDEYLKHLELMKEMNIDIAGDFLVMASTLMYIKSRSLLPTEQQQEEEDLKEELIEKMLEYQKYKEISKALQDLLEAQKNIYYRKKPIFTDEDLNLNITIFDLIQTLKNLLEKVPPEIKELIYEEVPIEEKIREILTIVEEKKKIKFQDLIFNVRTRLEIITFFLAMLELIRLKQIFVIQENPFGDIIITEYENKATN